jgi:5-methylcytosine-specific restriction endonuclease McrA
MAAICFVGNGMGNPTRPWVKLPTSIIDDYRWARLSDTDWKRAIENYANDPKNIHYEMNPLRYSYMLVRKQRIKEVFSRDEHVCRYCGSTDNLEIDHIIPLALGGSNDPDNLQILCKKCNRKKWKSLP